jgi:hypothetical protein
VEIKELIVGLSIGDKVIANKDCGYKIKKGMIGSIIGQEDPFFGASTWKISWNSGAHVESVYKDSDGISKI